MSLTKAEKSFDCLKFKDRAQERIYEQIRDLTHEEEIDYFERRARTGPLAEWLLKVRRGPAKRS